MTDTNPTPEIQAPSSRWKRSYSIVATLGGERAIITQARGEKEARRFLRQMSAKYRTEAVIFDVYRNPPPATVRWQDIKRELGRLLKTPAPAAPPPSTFEVVKVKRRRVAA